MSANDVLELTTIAPERQKALLRTNANPGGLRAGGEPYELLSPNELSLMQLHELQTQQTAIVKLFEKDPVKADEAMNQIVALILIDAPAADIKALPFLQKADVMRSFSEAVTGRLQTPAASPSEG